MNINRIIVLSVCLTSFASSFMSSSLNIAVNAIAADFSVSPELITYAVSAYVIAATAMLLPSSALANRLGYLRAYRLGAALSCAAALLVALSPSFVFLAAARGVQGAVNSIIFTTGTAVISDRLPAKARGAAIGLSTACIYAGLTLSPPLGGVLTDTLGWKSMFLISAVLYASGALISRAAPRDAPQSRGYPYIRMALAASGFALLLFGLDRITEGALFPLCAAAGAAVLCCYLWIEQKKAARPLLKISLVAQNRVLLWALCASFLNYLGTFAITLLLSMHLQLLSGMSAMSAGTVLILGPLLQCLVSPAAGKLTAKVSPHLIVCCGMAVSTAGIIVLATLTQDSPLWQILCGQGLTGLGFGFFSAPNTTIVMNSVDRSRFALVSALQAITRNAGMSVCMALVTGIFALGISAPSLTLEYLAQLQRCLSTAFTLAAGLGVLGVLSCFAGMRAAKKSA
ncbi:MAG: MFS transporter [Succinivibrio sp.]|jgi:MFS family permease|nr:MFS transporter [Succinivibrio sp.]